MDQRAISKRDLLYFAIDYSLSGPGKGDMRYCSDTGYEGKKNTEKRRYEQTINSFMIDIYFNYCFIVQTHPLPPSL